MDTGVNRHPDTLDTSDTSVYRHSSDTPPTHSDTPNRQFRQLRCARCVYRVSIVSNSDTPTRPTRQTRPTLQHSTLRHDQTRPTQRSQDTAPAVPGHRSSGPRTQIQRSQDTGPAVRHVRHPRHARHARHSDTRHRPDTPTPRHSDTPTLLDTLTLCARLHCQGAPTLPRHCSPTLPDTPTPVSTDTASTLPRHCPTPPDTLDTSTHQGSRAGHSHSLRVYTTSPIGWQ